MAVYTCSDLHGHLDIYKQIKAFIKPKDTVYFLGDAGDRGPQSWECIKTIYNDSQFIYLKGNHEDLLVKACQDYLADDYMWDYYSYSNSYRNGGEQTMKDWEEDPEREKWLSYIALLPTFTLYRNAQNQNILLTHAGFTPWLGKDNIHAHIPVERELLWNRNHYYEEWNSTEMEDCIIVHGHTSTHHIIYDLLDNNYDEGPYWYCDNHKVDIDTGGFFTGEFCLLNLDTWESHMFYTKV